MRASSIVLPLVGIGLVMAGVMAGYSIGKPSDSAASSTSSISNPDARKVIYWYDPMKPDQHFDKPGRSPFMDMELVPKYAGTAEDTRTLTVPSQAVQSLGIRTTKVTLGIIDSGTDAVASIAYNQREIATLQARASGYVEKVYGRAAGDVLPAGAPLADLLIPEWSAAQIEFITVKQSGDPELIEATRERLRLLGMSQSTINQVQRSGKPVAAQTIFAPIGGELQSLGLQVGMSVSKGQDLAKINGLSTVWLDAAIPEAALGNVRLGSTMVAKLAAFPGHPLTGKVIGILPSADNITRTITVRSELANAEGLLRPGMFATVRLGTSVKGPVLLIPSESVIRTGKRTLVMLAEAEGRYRPEEIGIGREAEGKTEVLSGLSEGQQIVSSGQFLLDSESSLQGLMTRNGTGESSPRELHLSKGEIVDLDKDTVTLKHGPFPSLGMPGMTMPFPLAKPELLDGFRIGDHVDIAISKGDTGLLVERLTRQGAGQ
ncbi:efflux RND transporter periplasmic adaptor subunit [Pseudomonas syringae pv. syringae]|uniref:efflux RND transporter periplasmic adaptor subunit n=1 Tax=Pseudomonas syringae TaxID=317 RepID=UPI001F0EF112|nr:efflux RND transporter periplasmic adaptor subunit [Pseudomonas syringae]MCH5633802.1 efflux RND transporter periplasmic adaptor subunit [Pseudomonas syringae pv. syringae]MCH5663028.1 efflux RND transporter periplasmic adaptor subunit [Pseudomonas syringae pv. syringae]